MNEWRVRHCRPFSRRPSRLVTPPPPFVCRRTSGMSANASVLAMPLEMVDTTCPPNSVAPLNSHTAAMRTACRSVMALAPTLDPNAFCRSCCCACQGGGLLHARRVPAPIHPPSIPPPNDTGVVGGHVSGEVVPAVCFPWWPANPAKNERATYRHVVHPYAGRCQQREQAACPHHPFVFGGEHRRWAI